MSVASETIEAYLRFAFPIINIIAHLIPSLSLSLSLTHPPKMLVPYFLSCALCALFSSQKREKKHTHTNTNSVIVVEIVIDCEF